MSKESADRELLTAARAVEQQLITAEDLAQAVAQWTATEEGCLLPLLESLSELADDQQIQLRRLFREHEATLVADIADSIDDSLFGKLNNALANVGNDDLQASIARWQKVEARVPLSSVSESERFEIISEHARGGLGEVLVAADRQLNRRVALKRIREKWANDEHAKLRFQQEAEITGRLEHPGVVPVYALGQRPDGQIYYAMRFIRGESLEAATRTFHESQASQSMNPRSPEFRDLLRRFVNVCNTIAYAHSRGIIHRDLKPANIMLGNYGETLVVDWGLAKQIEAAEAQASAGAESIIAADSGSGSAPTQFGSAVGTPQYMSPEQATGRIDRMGPATDVFGLGATLYHILTGQPPQQQDTVGRMLERVEYGDFPKPTAINAQLPLALEAICLKAMALRAPERYPSPMQLAEDTERWLADEPIAVCHDSFTVRATRWVRKHQTLAAVSAVAMLLLTIGSVAGSVAWNQFKDQQLSHEREQARKDAEQKEQDRVRDAELHEQEQIRLTELTASLETTHTIVRQQVEDGHLAMAVSVLEGEIHALSTESSFDESRIRMTAKVDRLNRIVEFYHLSELAQQANYLAQDEDEILATVRGMELLGIWNQADWWNHLPADDLNPGQHDHLKETVYRNLVLLASTFTKRMGLQTLKDSGGKMPQSMTDRLAAVFGKDGKTEARATIITCDLASRFRPAECLRWYRSVAAFRLLKGLMIPVRRLGPPRNAADAYEIGVLALSSHIVDDFPFTHYQGVDDDLMSARETFGVASEMAPDHYWTQLLLAQTEYMMAERAAARNDPEAWQYFETSRRTFGRCVTLQPQLPFAFADLSTVCLRAREVIENSQVLSQEDIERNQRILQDSCIKYAQEALKRDPNAAWAYWHEGHALASVGQIDDAMEAYRSAIELGYRFGVDNNTTLIDVDRIRGRKRAIEKAQAQLDAGNDRSIFHAVIGAALLMTADEKTARPFIMAARNHSVVHPFAWSAAGVLAMNDDDFEDAEECFRNSLRSGQRSFWATYGLGRCLEQNAQFREAYQSFEAAIELARSPHHRADAMLGLCRLTLLKEDNQTAALLLREARISYPACSLQEVRALAKKQGNTWFLNAIDELKPFSVTDIVNNPEILRTNIVAVHNAGFEMPLEHDWLNPGAHRWTVSPEARSTANLDYETYHGGQSSLHIVTSTATAQTPAATSRTISVEADRRYGISLWVKSHQSETGSLSIAVTPEAGDATKAVIDIPRGIYDWQQIVGTFDTPKSTRRENQQPMTLHIRSTAPTDVWIDDIEIMQLPRETP